MIASPSRLPRLLAALLLAPLATAGEPDAPNLLLFVADQHNPRALGVAGNGYGGATAKMTPHLDRLAAEGVYVPRASCAAPQCQPARVTMLTGLAPHHHGVRSNNVWEPAVGLTTLPQLLREAGYRTANIGKHHLEWLDQRTLAPTDHGYDEVLDLDDYADFCLAHGERMFGHPDRIHTIPGLPPGLDPVGYTDNTNEFTPSGYVADRSIEFLEARAQDGVPFALWCNFQGPHTPILPTGPSSPEDWAHRFDPYTALDLPANVDKVPDTQRLAHYVQDFLSMTPDQHRDVLARYFGLVSQIDSNVGRVLRRLDELGLSERTLVVYTADHGEFGAEMGAWKKGGGAYDCLTRIPLILRLPGTLPAASVFPHPLGQVDLVPTLAELLALSPPDEVRARWDGRSMAEPLRTGLPAADDPRMRFVEFQNGNSGLLRAVVTATEKLTLDEYGTGDLEYFDLATDPWEEHNLASDPSAQPRVQALSAALRDWWGDPADHAPAYLLTGGEDSPPIHSYDPRPRSATTGVARDRELRWVPATSAARQELWVGLGGAPLELWAVLPAMTDRFHPGLLPPSTQVEWRVDGQNANGLTLGHVWSFTTSATPDGPEVASRPKPGDGARNVPRTADLHWTLGAGAERLTLWLAVGDEPLTAVHDRPLTTNGCDLPLLPAGETVRWRVDGHDDAGTTIGPEWSFVVSEKGLAGPASEPSPPHLALDVSLDLGEPLRWTPGADAVQHRVHFGTEHPLPLCAEVAAPEWAPGPLELGRTYYWRVDEVDEAGVRRGRTWRFTADG